MRPISNRILLIVALSIALIACSRSKATRGNWTRCTCPYLTDFDDRAIHNVQVCSPSPDKSQQIAVDCADRLAHGHVDSCSCDSPKSECLTSDPCKSEEYK